jgi:hypothetical protein
MPVNKSYAADWYLSQVLNAIAQEDFAAASAIVQAGMNINYSSKAYISQAQQEMIANEEASIKRLSLKHKVPLSKLRTIITNIRVVLEENKYTCPENYALELMQSAFENLPYKKAMDFLEAKELAKQVIKPLLYNELINVLGAHLSIDELMKQCNEVKKLLKTHKTYIIQTGLLPVTLNGLPWLESVFLRFYSTKVTTSKWPSNLPKPPFTFSKSNLIPVVKHTDCSYEDADRVSGLSEKDEILVERLRPVLIDIAIDVITLIESTIKGTLNSQELELKFVSILSKRLKNKDLEFLLKFDERFSIAMPDDCKGNEPLVINTNFSSYLQSDGLLSNLVNLVVNIKHEFFDNPIREAFADPKYDAILNKLKKARSNPNLGSSYFESQPITSEMIELLNLMENKGDSLRTNRNLSIKLMSKKLRDNRKKKRKRFITKAIEPKCKKESVFRCIKDKGTWEIKYKGKVVGGKPIKNSKGYILIRELLTNPGVPYSVESLHKMILSEYVPSSLGSPIGTETPKHTDFEVKAIASDKKFYTPHKRIKKQFKLVTSFSDRLQDPTLTEEERENTTSEYHKASDYLKMLEENALPFKRQSDRIYKQIKDSKIMLGRHCLELQKHLNNAIKQDNGSWVYDPEVPIDWIIA